MSKVEELKRRVEEQLPPEEAEIVKNFIDTRLTEEAAGGLLALDGMTFTEKVQTKKVRVVNDYKDIEKMRKEPYSPPEDYGEIEIQKAFPRISELLFLIVSYNVDPETLEQGQSTQSEDVHGFFSLFGDLLKTTKPPKQPKQHSIVVTPVARDIKKDLREITNNPEEKKRGIVAINSERRPSKAEKKNQHTIISTTVSTKITAFYTAKGKAEYHPIDSSIAGAIADLINDGNDRFTPASIWRAVARLKDGQKVTPQRKKEVRENVERQLLTALELDVTEEVQIMGLEDRLKDLYDERSGRYRLRANMLTLEPALINTNGRIENGWKIVIDPDSGKPILPALYRLALMITRSEDKPQIASYDNDEISLEGTVRMTETVVIIRDALLDNIHRIKNGTGDAISFSQIYDLLRISATGDNPTEREQLKKERLRARKTTEAILDRYVFNGLIKKYEIMKNSSGGKIIITTEERGSLIIYAHIKGDASTPETPFSFNIKLRKKISGEYGETRFDKGEASITVMNGLMREIPGLPAGTGYTITPAGSLDYKLIQAAHEEGGIQADTPSKATFIFSPKKKI